MIKQSQKFSLDGVDVKNEPVSEDYSFDVNESDDNDATVMLEFEDQPPILFELPDIPGQEGDDIIVEDDDVVEEEVDEVEVEEEDPWNWRTNGLGGFLGWVQRMMENVPKHSGWDTTGLERAIAWFQRVDREISKALREDFKNEIKSADAEKARDAVLNAVERLIDRLDKARRLKPGAKRKEKKDKKSAGYESEGFLKEAKSTRITGIQITVPLFISTLARTCINGMVSAGHDIEDMFEKLAKEYSLDKREKAELVQLLADMGYSVRRDRGILIGEPVDEKSSENFDWAANYRA